MQSAVNLKKGAIPSLSSFETALEAAIVQTIAYVDVFDYPLTAAEVHRYLEGISVPEWKVEALLANGRLVPHRISRCQGYFMLPGREDIIATRQKREENARKLWPEALRYGRLIASLPFVKMVAVTGSLAVNNADPNADIDYLIITENGRLWLCRAFTIAIVKLAARQGITLCPNYFLSERSLVFEQRNLYIARELAQMIPISGFDVYEKLRQLNTWTADFLPNAHHSPRQTTVPFSHLRHIRKPIEVILRSPLGTHLEKWEMTRKIHKFSDQTTSRQAIETSFSADWCKGHFDGHAHWILQNYAERLNHLQGD